MNCISRIAGLLSFAGILALGAAAFSVWTALAACALLAAACIWTGRKARGARWSMNAGQLAMSAGAAAATAAVLAASAGMSMLLVRTAEAVFGG